VQDHITVHHLSHLRFWPSKSWVPDNGKTRLEHTKCPQDLLSSCLLTLGKPRLLLWSWPGNCLHKYSPRWIDIIGEVVPFGVGLVVDLKVNRRSVLWTQEIAAVRWCYRGFLPFRRKNAKSIGRDRRQLQGSHCIPHCGLCTALAKQTGNSSKPNACNRYYQTSQEILSLHFVQGFRLCLLHLVVAGKLDQTLPQLPNKTWRHNL
jgi:hypothetical protein